MLDSSDGESVIQIPRPDGWFQQRGDTTMTRQPPRNDVVERSSYGRRTSTLELPNATLEPARQWWAPCDGIGACDMRIAAAKKGLPADWKVFSFEHNMDLTSRRKLTHENPDGAH